MDTVRQILATVRRGKVYQQEETSKSNYSNMGFTIMGNNSKQALNRFQQQKRLDTDGFDYCSVIRNATKFTEKRYSMETTLYFTTLVAFVPDMHS
eukprot:6200180-Pleurochrysis_carterae.AAC.1